MKAADASNVSKSRRAAGALFLAGISLLLAGCSRPPAKTEPAAAQPSQIKVDVKPGGPIVLTTSSAEFQILPSGYIQASLLKGDQKLTLDEPAATGSDFLVMGGKKIQFAPDFAQAKVSDSVGKLGKGKRVEIPAESSGGSAAGIQRTVSIEIYDDFPNILLSSAVYKNAGGEDFHVDRVVEQQHKFSASGADKKVQPYDMWSFHGASYDWGEDDVVKLTRTFAQPNLMGATVKGGYGGGIPVVAFWTAASARRSDMSKQCRSPFPCR